MTFAPDGPLRQISIPQTRLLKERAQYLPHQGSRRVFLIDHVDRANEQAANSLLKTLEEPPDAPDPDHDGGERLRPAADDPLARRAVSLRAARPRRDARVRRSARTRPAGAPHRAGGRQPGRRGVARSGGLRQAPRRDAGAVEGGGRESRRSPRGCPVGEAIGRSKSEKLELLPQGALRAAARPAAAHEGGGEIRNQDIRRELEALAGKVEFAWIRKAVAQVDELVEFMRRNIQKTDRARCANYRSCASA